MAGGYRDAGVIAGHNRLLRIAENSKERRGHEAWEGTRGVEEDPLRLWWRKGKRSKVRKGEWIPRLWRAEVAMTP